MFFSHPALGLFKRFLLCCLLAFPFHYCSLYDPKNLHLLLTNHFYQFIYNSWNISALLLFFVHKILTILLKNWFLTYIYDPNKKNDDKEQ